jgi:hypothetical protein
MTRIVTADEISMKVCDALDLIRLGWSGAIAAAITAWLAEQPAPKPGHVKVRAAVAVSADGTWVVSGCSSWTDSAAHEIAVDAQASLARVSFIEANAPLPEPPATIQAHVEGVS